MLSCAKWYTTFSRVPLGAATHTRVSQVACGNVHTLLLLEDGTVVACGDDSCGQLGSRSSARDRTSRLQFAVVATSRPVLRVDCGAYCSFFRLEDGTVVACGDNTRGQLVVGTENPFIHYPTPVLVPTGLAQVASGYAHTFFRFEDGSVMASGSDDTGQLGLGTVTATIAGIPVLVSSPVAGIVL